MSDSERVLLVDDDPNVLKAYKRRLRKRFQIETALCSEEGVTAVNFLGPFAVIVSDMTMPRENGAAFLARMLKLSPDSVRIMLTGNADQQTAVDAVNQARVFRFLNKPCDAEELESAIEAGIAEYRRLATERELLSQTVHGVVTMLTRVLSTVSPTAFGRATRLRALAGDIAKSAEIDDAWELEIAAALSQLGAVTMTDETVKKIAVGQELTEDEAEAAANQYRVAAELIAEAPRLEAIARVVGLQGAESDSCDEFSAVTRNAELLRVVIDFDRLTSELDQPAADALHELEANRRFDRDALVALRKFVAKRDARQLFEVGVEQLVDGVRIVEDVTTTSGMVLISKGHDVTDTLRDRLQNYAATHEIALPIRVLAPAAFADTLRETAATA